jgi:hypothetical protein
VDCLRRKASRPRAPAKPNADTIESLFAVDGERRCRTCDFPYSIHIPSEVRDHEQHHEAFLRARDEGWAPLSQRDTEHMRGEGLRMACDGHCHEVKVAGAERWLDAEHHDHHARVLLYGSRRFSRRELFAWLDQRGCLGRFGADVIAVLRERYA